MGFGVDADDGVVVPPDYICRAYEAFWFVVFVFNDADDGDNNTSVAKDFFGGVFLGGGAIDNDDVRVLPLGMFKAARENFAESGGVIRSFE